MPLMQTLLLGLTGITFAIWTYLMFRTLMDQRRRATMRTGQTFPGLRDALLEWQHWLTTPERASDRWQLLVATLILFALIGLNVAFSPMTALSTDTIPT